MNCSSGKRSSGPRVPAAAGPPSAHAILSRVTSRTGVANAVVDEGAWMHGSAPALQALSQQNGTNRRARRCCGQHAFDPGRFKWQRRARRQARRRASRPCGLVRLASPKAAHEPGRHSAGIRRGHFPFRRARIDPQGLLQRSAREAGEKAFARAGDYDEDGAYPAADVASLREAGLLTAVLPSKCGGAELTGVSLSDVLRSIGSGSLPLGRLFEGHVNALELVLRYGNAQQIEMSRGKLEKASCSASGTQTMRTGFG